MVLVLRSSRFVHIPSDAVCDVILNHTNSMRKEKQL